MKTTFTYTGMHPTWSLESYARRRLAVWVDQAKTPIAHANFHVGRDGEEFRLILAVVLVDGRNFEVSRSGGFLYASIDRIIEALMVTINELGRPPRAQKKVSRYAPVSSPHVRRVHWHADDAFDEAANS